MSPIGFVLLTHENPKQILRLVSRLNFMFDAPLIAWHHDISAPSLPEAKGNILFIPRRHGKWGGFGIVEATADGIELLFTSRVPPVWFVVLSGADYPVKSAEQTYFDLSAAPYDAHMDFALADDPNYPKAIYQRYFCRRIPLPLLRRFALPRFPTPFSPKFRCYTGSQWFCGNAAVANRIIEFHRSRPYLARYYRSAKLPDESYFQCILANAPGLKLNNDELRYADWSGGGTHPKWLTTEDDLRAALSSKNHFARKFDGRNSKILDEIDRATNIHRSPKSTAAEFFN
jgi:hypothetical protein